MAKGQPKQEWYTLTIRASGKKNQSEWCRENSINIRNFNRWYNKLKKQANPTATVQGWIPLSKSCMFFLKPYYDYILTSYTCIPSSFNTEDFGVWQ